MKKGSPKGDFFRYRAKYGLADVSSRAGMTGPDPDRSGAGNARARVWGEKFKKILKKGIDRTLKPCYNITIVKENRKEKNNAIM